MTIVCVLEKMVGRDCVPDFRIAVDLPHRFVLFEFETYSFSWPPPSSYCYLYVVNVLFALFLTPYLSCWDFTGGLRSYVQMTRLLNFSVLTTFKLEES
jgi:hypothetical protein